LLLRCGFFAFTSVSCFGLGGSLLLRRGLLVLGLGFAFFLGEQLFLAQSGKTFEDEDTTEEKVIDHMLTEIDVTDKKVTKEEL
ncbi:hypothetical protein ACC759_38045, partial [Rhizobium ruizarguesonis]